ADTPVTVEDLLARAPTDPDVAQELRAWLTDMLASPGLTAKAKGLVGIFVKLIDDGKIGEATSKIKAKANRDFFERNAVWNERIAFFKPEARATAGTAANLANGRWIAVLPPGNYGGARDGAARPLPSAGHLIPAYKLPQTPVGGHFVD